MHSSLLRTFFLCGALALGSGVKAGIIFSDDFSQNTSGWNSTPLGWTITGTGTVDILGQCNNQTLNDLLPGNNCYIDLEGNTGINGLLTKQLFLASGHSYNAFFDLAGNNEDWWPFGDEVTITFGTAVSIIYLEPDDPFETNKLSFIPPAAGFYSLSFINSNIDGYGALLDNVRIEQVPGPIPLLGAGAVWGFSRRLRSRRRRLDEKH